MSLSRTLRADFRGAAEKGTLDGVFANAGWAQFAALGKILGTLRRPFLDSNVKGFGFYVAEVASAFCGWCLESSRHASKPPTVVKSSFALGSGVSYRRHESRASSSFPRETWTQWGLKGLAGFRVTKRGQPGLYRHAPMRSIDKLA